MGLAEHSMRFRSSYYTSMLSRSWSTRVINGVLNNGLGLSNSTQCWAICNATHSTLGLVYILKHYQHFVVTMGYRHWVQRRIFRRGSTLRGAGEMTLLQTLTLYSVQSHDEPLCCASRARVPQRAEREREHQRSSLIYSHAKIKGVGKGTYRTGKRFIRSGHFDLL